MSARGLETHSCPRTGLLMTSDVTEGASVVSRLGGGAASNGNAKSTWRGEGGRPIKRSALPDLWFLIARGARRARRTARSSSELGPERLDLDVWLIPPSPRYAARNFSIEKTVSRDSM